MTPPGFWTVSQNFVNKLFGKLPTPAPPNKMKLIKLYHQIKFIKSKIK
jgi:hypothetical protein